MEWYPTILTFHIIFAGGWLINLFSDLFLKDFINKNKGKQGEKKLISLYLSLTNLLGIIGSTGILLTGIIMVIINPAYGFFQMSANHWLTVKQILMVGLLLIIFIFIIPNAKRLRVSIGQDLENESSISEEGYNNLKKIYKLNTIINLMVIINFLFAITHRFIG